jgi:hypothetical protein
MKIIYIDLHGLRNEEWYQFYVVFRSLVQKYGAETLNVVELFAVFVTLFTRADMLLEIIRKSPTTEKMVEADHLREATYGGLLDSIVSWTKQHVNAAKKDAATTLMIVLDNYGRPSKMSADKETGVITNLVQDLNGPYLPQVDLLDLKDWVSQLNTDNIAYETLFELRNTEYADRPEEQFKVARKETDGVYEQITERINAMITINGDSAYHPFVSELDALIKHYNNLIAQRRGERQAHKEAKEAKKAAKAVAEAEKANAKAAKANEVAEIANAKAEAAKANKAK